MPVLCHGLYSKNSAVPCFFVSLTFRFKSEVAFLAAKEAGKTSILHFQIFFRREEGSVSLGEGFPKYRVRVRILGSQEAMKWQMRNVFHSPFLGHSVSTDSFS